MNLPADLPHSGIELVGLAIICLVTWAMYRQNRVASKLDATHKEVGEVKRQVVNGHADNPDAPKLRDDLERIAETVDEIRQECRDEFRAVRAELLSLSERQRIQIAGIYDEMDHHRKRNL